MSQFRRFDDPSATDEHKRQMRVSKVLVGVLNNMCENESPSFVISSVSTLFSCVIATFCIDMDEDEAIDHLDSILKDVKIACCLHRKSYKERDDGV